MPPLATVVHETPPDGPPEVKTCPETPAFLDVPRYILPVLV
jgi:hypothetical protein